MLLPIAKVMRFQLKLAAFSCELTLHNNYRVFTHGNLEFLCHFGVNTVTELVEFHWIYNWYQMSDVRCQTANLLLKSLLEMGDRGEIRIGEYPIV